MKTTIFYMMFFVSSSLCLMDHPLTMGLIMLLYILLMCMMMGLMSWTFWYSYIIFLIMVGALLIMFIYMTMLVPNKKFNFSKLIIFLMMLFFLISMNEMFYNDNLILFMNNMSTDMINMNKSILNIKNSDMENFPILWIYDSLNKNFTMMLMFFLFYILTIIVNIINIDLGTMRKLKNKK